MSLKERRWIFAKEQDRSLLEYVPHVRVLDEQVCTYVGAQQADGNCMQTPRAL